MKNMLFAAITAAALLSIQTGNAQSYSKSFDCTGFDKIIVEVVQPKFLKHVDADDKIKASVNVIKSDSFSVEFSTNNAYYSKICTASVNRKGALTVKVDFSDRIPPDKDTSISIEVRTPSLTRLDVSGSAAVNASGEFETSGDFKAEFSTMAVVNGLSVKARNASFKMGFVAFANGFDVTASSGISLKGKTCRVSSSSFKADAVEVTVSSASDIRDVKLKANTLDLSVSQASQVQNSTASFTTGNIDVENASVAELKSFSEDDFADDLQLKVKYASRGFLSDLRCRNVNAKIGKSSAAKVHATESLTYKNEWTSTVTNSVTAATVTDKSSAKVRARGDY